MQSNLHDDTTMTDMKKFPIGTEDFKDIINNNYYYVDKTRLIKELVDIGSKVTLFTRPRRFGKSLNMSMLKSFFEIGADSNLFSKLYIGSQSEFCEQYMGKYPVVSLCLKDVEGATFEEAQRNLCFAIQLETARYGFILDDDKLQRHNRKILEDLMALETQDISRSLRGLSQVLCRYYDRKVIILIDEYDAPLASAFKNGYYDQMISLIRSLFSWALKGNSDLEFAVLTGCLRISKESIFTGMNNLDVNTVADILYDDAFGFTDEEVNDLLDFYELGQYHDIIKEWYDGYRFGNAYIYCPWDVLNYCRILKADSNAKPQKYWMNSSSNDIVGKFIDQIIASGDASAQEDFVKLAQGEAVNKYVNSNITYKELYSSVDNMWSTLFMTGYLTSNDGYYEDRYNLTIPNLEIRAVVQEIFIEQFKNADTAYTNSVFEFYRALQDGDIEIVREFFENYLRNSGGIRIANARKDKKENFYQGLFLGMLVLKSNWKAKAECEYGDGYVDLSMLTDKPGVGVIIEFKYSDSKESLNVSVQEALDQIEKKRYADGFFRQHESVDVIYKYGIACHAMDCDIEMRVENRG